MSNTGQRHRNLPSTPINSWLKHKISTIIDKPPGEKQKEDAIPPDGFWRINHWWPHWYRCTDKRHFGSGFAKNSFASTANIFNWGSTPGLRNIGSQWTFQNGKGSSWTSFRSWGHFVQRNFILVTNLTSPLNGLLFLQRNSTISDMRRRVLNFPFFSLQLKHADNT